MKIHPQVITQNNHPAFVVLPYNEYEHLLEILEDIEDIEAIRKVTKEKHEHFPLDLVERIASGENAIKVFREYRSFSQVELAKKVGVSKQYISQIENGERTGTTKILKTIAKVLAVDLEDIV